MNCLNCDNPEIKQDGLCKSCLEKLQNFEYEFYNQLKQMAEGKRGVTQ